MDSEFFTGFSQCRLFPDFPRFLTAAGKGYLCLMTFKFFCSAGEDKMESILKRINKNQDTGFEAGVLDFSVDLVSGAGVRNHFDLGR
jgi:hypothetical protein